ncbi:hypothetical protein D047_0590B, partial [Vibrio parahaemolyticus VPTS-2010_2]
PIACINKKF